MIDPIVRFRVDFANACSVGPRKIAMLEGIGRSGSLLRAARDLAMSYRGGGGARLTAFGRTLISHYRTFEKPCVRAPRRSSELSQAMLGGERIPRQPHRGGGYLGEREVYPTK